MDIKGLTNDIYESLRDDGFFKSEFIDEHKFKARFYARSYGSIHRCQQRPSASTTLD